MASSTGTFSARNTSRIVRGASTPVATSASTSSTGSAVVESQVDALTPGVSLGSWGRRRGGGLFIVPPDEQDDLHER